ncbi:DUF4384 domain-containing protein [Deinococcus lacus]|uniref:DUF4384 domain-containing protein n=1 Tax=Deinococcus lacus TaxID=392561 RepID=A0ABW1YE04_9DEIO
MKKNLLGLSALALTGLLGSASAAPVISAQSIIVNPVQSPIDVQVWTDRSSNAQAVPNYQPGDRIRLFTKVSQDAYVYLFNVDPSGQVDLILPNNYNGGANFVRAGSTYVFPAAGDNFTFDIAEPYGLNKVLAVASRQPLDISQIAQFRSQNSFANVNVQGQQQLAQALSIVVNPVQQTSWDSATAFYNVVPRRAAPVQPAPVRPAPLPGRPTQVVTLPELIFGQPVWNISFEFSNSRLREVHDQYAATLRSQGYNLTSTRVNGNRMYSTFSRGFTGYDTATLTVTQNGSTYDVKVVTNR